jgi:hypothetical protein
VKDLVWQIARADSFAVHERSAKHVVHPRTRQLRVAGVMVTHGELDDVRKKPSVHEHFSWAKYAACTLRPGCRSGWIADSRIRGHKR